MITPKDIEKVYTERNAYLAKSIKENDLIIKSAKEYVVYLTKIMVLAKEMFDCARDPYSEFWYDMESGIPNIHIKLIVRSSTDELMAQEDKFYEKLYEDEENYMKYDFNLSTDFVESEEL